MPSSAEGVVDGPRGLETLKKGNQNYEPIDHKLHCSSAGRYMKGKQLKASLNANVECLIKLIIFNPADDRNRDKLKLFLITRVVASSV